MAVISRNSEPEDERNSERKISAVSNVEEDLDSQDIEYTLLNDALDEISNCLDDLERRNEALHRELSSLLESNRQIRKEFQNATA